MTTFTWTTSTTGDWAIATNWSPAAVPDANTAVAILPGVTSAGAYTVTIAAGESEIINAITLGDLTGGHFGPTLDVAGTLTFAGAGPSMAFLSGTMQIDIGGVLAGVGSLGTTQGPGVSVINNGTLHGNAGANQALSILTGFTNNGTVLADNGNVGIEGPAGLTNLSGTTLTGGTWIAQGPTAGTFNQIELGFNFDAVIAVDAAKIVLDGAASDFQGYSSGAFQPIEQQLQTIASNGTLQLLSNRGYTTTNALQDNGVLLQQGGTLTTSGLTLGGSGTLNGFGVVSGAIANQGGITASGGALDLTNPVTGTGGFTVASGATLILDGATPATLNNSGTVYDTSGLLNIQSLSGTGSLVVQNGGTLEFAGATGQDVGFSGSNATLRFDNFAGYSGTLVGFAQGDTLVLAGTSATTAFVSGSSLVVMNNSSTVDTIQVAGSYAPGASFSVVNSGGNAVVSNTSGAPLQQDFQFNVLLSDTAGLTTTQENRISNDLSAAALDWAQYITGHNTLRIQLDIVSGGGGAELATGGATTNISNGQTLDGRNLLLPSSLIALNTGNYVPGLTSDVTVTLFAGNLGSLYVNPSPTPKPSGTVPSGEFDLVTVFRHELAHGFGFGGLTTNTGTLGSQETEFDHFIQKNGDGSAQFIGPQTTAEAQALFGSPIVQLTTLTNGEGYAHFANTNSDPNANDLMSGLGLPPATQRDISAMDLRVLQDVGESVTALCFLAGTRIATPTGEVPVERLAAGDEVISTRGMVCRIVWIGKGTALVTPGRRNAATPVVVRKGALADNVPHHDLRVTKGHSLYLDSVLIPVESLINHRSILWDDHARAVSIYHIELETHDVLLANGAPAESYRDDGNRWLFQNANTGWGGKPQEPCAPVLADGAHVDQVWRRLLERAGPRPGLPLTADPDLHLVVDGKRLDAIERSANRYAFRLRARPHTVRIRSRAAIPQELGLRRDPRELGVAVRRLVLMHNRWLRALEAGDGRLVDGFHDFEAGDGMRWTNGDAGVSGDLFAGMTSACTLSLYLGGSTQYADEGDRQVA
jgi:hypothetical protein